MSLDNILLIPGVGGAKGLLDLYPGAAAAYSLRKLRNAYSGPCVRVRRASDSAEQDIGFASSFVDESSIASFCGATDGLVVTWYDQAGAFNATQATAGDQPKIYDGSTGVVKYDGKSVIQNPVRNSGYGVYSSLNIQNQTITLFGVYGAAATEPEGMILSTTNSAAFFGTIQDGSAGGIAGLSTFTGLVNGSTLISSPGTTRDQMHTAIHVGSLVHVSIVAAVADDVRWNNPLVFGTYTTGVAFSAACNYPEYIIYLSDKTSDAAAITANQMAYWGVS